MTRKIFFDQNGNELSFWINDKNQIYIQISESENPMLGRYITLDNGDVQELIEDLKILLNELT